MALLTNSKEIKRLKNAIKEADVQLCTKEAASDQLNRIFEALIDDNIEISRAMFNKLAKCYHKQDFNEQLTKASDFEDLYEGVIKNVQNP